MFDEERGIAVFSAYTLSPFMADFDHYPQRAVHDWYPTPGNTLYIHKMYVANPPHSHIPSTTLMFALSQSP